MKKIKKALLFPLIILLLSLFSYGQLDVFVQDQTTTPVDFFFTQIQGAPTTLAVNATIDDYSITVTSSASCTIGDYLGMFNSENSSDNRAYFGTIQGISGNIITLDTPLDFNFTVGNTIGCFDRNLNVDGSVTPQIYSIQVGPSATQSVDITRIMISMITDSAVSLAEFGDLPSLTNGLILRRVDGMTNNIWNVKNNGEIANLCFDYTPYSSTNPQQGQDGAKFRYTFGGQDKHGVVVRLNPGDKLQLIIQDDLTDLQQFRVIAEGHYVDDVVNDEVGIKMEEMVLLVVFIIGIVLTWLGYYVKNIYLISLGSLWFVMAGVTTFLLQGDVLGIPSWAQTIFFVAVGGVLAVNAWFYYDREKYRRNNY